jgi:hypothetical protein
MLKLKQRYMHGAPPCHAKPSVISVTLSSEKKNCFLHHDIKRHERFSKISIYRVQPIYTGERAVV